MSALDFLLKPIRYNKFITAVEKAREWFGHSQEHHAEEPAAIVNQDVAKPINTVFLKVDGEYRQVALDKILYVCGMKDYVMFYVEGERKPLITVSIAMTASTSATRLSASPMPSKTPSTSFSSLASQAVREGRAVSRAARSSRDGRWRRS